MKAEMGKSTNKLHWNSLKSQVNLTASKYSVYDWYLFPPVQRTNIWDYLSIQTPNPPNSENFLWQMILIPSPYMGKIIFVSRIPHYSRKLKLGFFGSLTEWPKEALSYLHIWSYLETLSQWFLTFLGKILLHVIFSVFWIRLLNLYYLWLLALWLNPAQAT